MKKQILFYVSWNILFLIQMYFFSKFDLIIRNIVKRSLELNYSIWFQIGWMILVGGFISVLAYKGSQFQKNRKSAILELIIIGIPAAYMMTILAIPYSLASVWGRNISYYIPFWLGYSTTPSQIAGIVFGYEIFIFIVRISKKYGEEALENTSG